MKIIYVVFTWTLVVVVVSRFIPDRCSYAHFEKFEKKYMLRCDHTESWRTYKNQTYEELLAVFNSNVNPSCTYVNEVKDYLRNKFDMCGKSFHYYARNIDCLNRADAGDHKQDFNQCAQHLYGNGEHMDCKGYLGCVQAIYSEDCGEKILALSCAKFIDTFRNLASFIHRQCVWSQVNEHCADFDIE